MPMSRHALANLVIDFTLRKKHFFIDRKGPNYFLTILLDTHPACTPKLLLCTLKCSFEVFLLSKILLLAQTLKTDLMYKL